jgi:hypothetical protein
MDIDPITFFIGLGGVMALFVVYAIGDIAGSLRRLTQLTEQQNRLLGAQSAMQREIHERMETLRRALVER